jgi:hypothetical protein
MRTGLNASDIPARQIGEPRVGKGGSYLNLRASFPKIPADGFFAMDRRQARAENAAARCKVDNVMSLVESRSPFPRITLLMRPFAVQVAFM